MHQPICFALALITLTITTTECKAAPDEQPHLITLNFPTEYQVIQRRTADEGTIFVGGRVQAFGITPEYRLSGNSRKSSVDSGWRPVEMHTASIFEARISAPAGGWYRLEFRIPDKNNQPVIDRVIEHVGVGEVFLIAGQSNSTNYGKPRQKPTSGKVSAFDGHAWRIADDPQPGTQDKSTGGSFIPSFGDAMVGRYMVPIGVASVGFGGTSVREWLPKGDRMKQQPTTGKHVSPVGENEWESTGQLFDGLMARINQLGPHGFRAVLWHQGESDAGQARAGYPADRQITGDQYRAWLKHIIDQSQQQAGWQFPWFVAQATYHSEKDPSDEEFRSAQKSLWDNQTIFPGPNTDQLTADYRNGVHFNAKGLAAHGKLWAEKVGNYLDPLVSQTPKPR